MLREICASTCALSSSVALVVRSAILRCRVLAANYAAIIGAHRLHEPGRFDQSIGHLETAAGPTIHSWFRFVSSRSRRDSAGRAPWDAGRPSAAVDKSRHGMGRVPLERALRCATEGSRRSNRSGPSPPRSARSCRQCYVIIPGVVGLITGGAVGGESLIPDGNPVGSCRYLFS